MARDRWGKDFRRRRREPGKYMPNLGKQYILPFDGGLIRYNRNKDNNNNNGKINAR